MNSWNRTDGLPLPPPPPGHTGIFQLPHQDQPGERPSHESWEFPPLLPEARTGLDASNFGGPSWDEEQQWSESAPQKPINDSTSWDNASWKSQTRDNADWQGSQSSWGERGYRDDGWTNGWQKRPLEYPEEPENKRVRRGNFEENEFVPDNDHYDTSEQYGLKLPRVIPSTKWSIQAGTVGCDPYDVKLESYLYKGASNYTMRLAAN